MSDKTVIVTFVKVAESTGTYKFILEKIKNPPSTRPSGTFDIILSEDSSGWGVQELDVLTVPAPFIVNITPATILLADLIQKNNEPATATTYEIRFTPINPIPADGSI